MHMSDLSIVHTAEQRTAISTAAANVGASPRLKRTLSKFASP